MRCRAAAVMLGLAVLLAACGDTRTNGEAPADGRLPAEAPAEAPADRAPADQPAPGELPPAPPVDSVNVVFTREEAPVTVRRPAFHESALLRTALEWLMRGPAEEERAAGLTSWFSGETAAVLRSAEVDDEGHATVEFQDLRPLIPNASTSAGSHMLLQELNGTVFQFPEIESVEYRMGGSCALFWEWLQYECHMVTRPEGR